jgi:hypothetical protein
MAVGEANTNDIFVLARKALEAAVRDEADMLAILEPTSAARSSEQVLEPA